MYEVVLNSLFCKIIFISMNFLKLCFCRASFRMTETDFASSKQSRSIPDRKGIFNHYFEADHPFVFLVWDYFSGMLILMGKVVQPTAIY